MWTTVEGIYRRGTIDLVEQRPDVEESRVLVTFLRPSVVRKPSRQMMFGQFPGRASARRRTSTSLNGVARPRTTMATKYVVDPHALTWPARATLLSLLP